MLSYAFTHQRARGDTRKDNAAAKGATANHVQQKGLRGRLPVCSRAVTVANDPRGPGSDWCGLFEQRSRNGLPGGCEHRVEGLLRICRALRLRSRVRTLHAHAVDDGVRVALEDHATVYQLIDREQ